MNRLRHILAYQCVLLPLVWMSWRRDDYLSDMEAMSRTDLGIVLFCTLAALYVYSRLFLFRSERDEIRFPRLLVQCLPILVLLIATPPLLSQDLYGYGILAWSTWWGRINPYLTPMAQVASHPWLPLPGDPFWLHEVTPYGPLAIVFSGLPLVLSGRNLLLFCVLYRALMTGMLVAVLLWVDRLNAQFSIDSRRAMADLPAILLSNPVLLVNGVLEGHNELLLVAVLVAFLCTYGRGHYGAAVASLAVGVAVKLSMLPLLPLLWFRSGRLSVRRMLVSMGGMVLLFACALAPFGFAFRGVLAGLAMQARLHCFYVCSPVTFLLDKIAPAHAVVEGRLLGLVLVLVAAWLFLVRRHAPILFGVVAICALLLTSVRFLTPWYFLPPLTLMAVASSSTRVNRLGVLIISIYSFSLYITF